MVVRFKNVSMESSVDNVGWRSASGNVSANDISAYERTHSIKLPEQYKKLILAHNGARPMKDSVMVGKRECVVERLISWDKNAKANIHFWQKSLSDHGIFPFASDPFGNVFCFDYSKGPNPNVVFWDHEEDRVTVVSENFDKFIASLK